MQMDIDGFVYGCCISSALAMESTALHRDIDIRIFLVRNDFYSSNWIVIDVRLTILHSSISKTYVPMIIALTR